MSFLKKLWHFIWYEDSLASWIVNVVLAVIIVKFVFYPVLGFILGTSYPVVAVVSESMEHNSNFDVWWGKNNGFYENLGITKEEFLKYPFKNGFNMGDLMILLGAKSIKRGDILVYHSAKYPNPIIHRVVVADEKITTKGDNVGIVQDFEREILNENKIGKAVIRIPFLGYIKILFTELVGGLRNVILS